MKAMDFVSTRGGQTVPSAKAIVKGLASDGGLFVPVHFPEIYTDELIRMSKMSYNERAAYIIGQYLTDFDGEELADMIKKAYSKFDDNGVAPLHKLSGGRYVMELYHGPTLAFKDVALTLLPFLLTKSAALTGETRDVMILVATSGDTGKAALAGFSGVPGTHCSVFYPDGGVSQAQRLQMVTQQGDNTHVIAVKGNFDSAQTGVKRIFSDDNAAKKFSENNYVLSSANSINWGRLVPQIVYYFSAYCDLVASSAIKAGDEINFCVPTGNFGNILAAYYAKRMGLPIGKLICASNANNVLTDFINTGVYDSRREFMLTSSPSMDILISSNLERMLYEICGHASLSVSMMMEKLKKEGQYSIDESALNILQDVMYGGWASEEEYFKKIKKLWADEKYLIDTHTAVAVTVLDKYRSETCDNRICVIASTASPFKFGKAVSKALGLNSDGDDFTLCNKLSDYTGIAVPKAIAELPTLPIRHKRVCAPEDMLSELYSELDIQ